MNESQIAVRYAKALFGAAEDQNSLDSIRVDVSLISQLIKDVDQLKTIIESPVIATSQKRKIFSSLFKANVQELTFKFIDLLVTNKREENMAGAFRHFEFLYKNAKGIKAAEVTTAVPLDSASFDKIKKLIEVKFNSKIELTSTVDEDILGGFIMRVEDQQYDKSIKAQLKEIENNLLNK
jgi:F-type H+-transporting ATPase subunit delta